MLPGRFVVCLGPVLLLGACQLIAPTDDLVAREDLPSAGNTGASGSGSAGASGSGAEAGQSGANAGGEGGANEGGRGGGGGEIAAGSAGDAGSGGGAAASGNGGAAAGAGVSGAAGASGDAGAGGGAGDAGASGTAGTGGSGGSAGTSGAAGTTAGQGGAGQGGGAGASGKAGAAGAAGGGTGKTKGQPCGGGTGGVGGSEGASHECAPGLVCVAKPASGLDYVPETPPKSRTCEDCQEAGLSATSAADGECYFAVQLMDGPTERQGAIAACGAYGAVRAKLDTTTQWKDLSRALPKRKMFTDTICGGSNDCTKKASWGDPAVDWDDGNPANASQAGTSYCGIVDDAEPRTFLAVACNAALFSYALCEVKVSTREN